MSVTDELLRNAERYAASFSEGGPAVAPARRLVVLGCTDSRIDLFALLGLDHGDAHVIRSAGGVVTDDAVRSIVVSQRLLGTRAILLVHHTDCGQARYTDDGIKAALEAETGIRPPFAFEAFTDADADVRQSMARIHASPFIPHKDDVRGFVYSVEEGTLREVR